MNRLLRTLTIVVVITLSTATLASAQSQTQSGSRAAGVSATAQITSANVPSSVGSSSVGSSPRNGRGGSVYGSTSSYSRSSSRSVSRSKRQVFIIPAAEIEREDHLAIERDIYVMSHIFDRVLRKPVNRIGGVFTVMDDFFGRDSHVTQVIYADGYGAMFFMDVDFALVGPPPASEAKEPNMPEEKVDTAWKQAERELYAPPNVTRGRGAENRPGPEYDAEKVELLKRNLVETLKHAANIQTLKSDESVILTVTGKAVMSATAIHRGESVEWAFTSGKWVPLTRDSRIASRPMLPPSVLTIRAKKSDIDAFSEGELDFSKFYERTQLLANWSGAAATERPNTRPANISIMRR